MAARAESATWRRLTPQDRVNHLLLFPEGVGSQDLEIVAEDIAAIHALPLLALLAVELRQMIPGHCRAFMMDEMQIVVEEDQGQGRFLDDNCPPVRAF